MPLWGALDVAAAVVMPVAVQVAALDGDSAMGEDVAVHGGRLIPQRERLHDGGHAVTLHTVMA